MRKNFQNKRNRDFHGKFFEKAFFGAQKDPDKTFKDRTKYFFEQTRYENPMVKRVEAFPVIAAQWM